MYKTKTMFNQMQSLISRYEFKKLVNDHLGDYGVKHFKTWNLLQVMLLVQIKSYTSIRDVQDSIRSKWNYWYHLGLKSLSRNNLSHALKQRPSIIFEKMFYKMISQLEAQRGIQNDKRFRFKNPVKAFDSSTISLCLEMFEWATFRQKKGGIKLHTMFDVKEQVPEFVHIGNARTNDSATTDEYPLKADAIYVGDRAYLKFVFLDKIRSYNAFFVMRTKKNTQYRIVKRHAKKHASIRGDWTVRLTGMKRTDYPHDVRVVRYRDPETKHVYEFITNNFHLSAKTIAEIYKSRWDIELFFKWIKQNLKIKTFLGTSENAVRIQIWTSLMVYVLCEYMKYVSKSTFSRLKIFRLIKENIFHEYDFYKLLCDGIPIKITPSNIDYAQMEFSF